MTQWAFISKPRGVVAGILSMLLVFYAFNFVPRNTNIVASKPRGIQIFDYILNFIFFFVVVYLVSCLFSYLYQKLFKHPG